ncbi:MAG: hypothetical protein HFH14_08985 [Lachnospiraceae bacterium]|nr:hypothetical protein [Lachnospiraceae bacterium]
MVKYIVIWIMYHERDVEKNKWFIDTCIETCRVYNMQMHLVTVEHFFKMHGKTQYMLPAAVVARMIHPAVSKLLEDEGVRVYNSYNVSNISNNKAGCMRYVHSLGVKHIPTLAISYTKKSGYVFEPVCSGGEAKVLRRLMEDVDIFDEYIIKSVSGHGGKEVMILSEYFKKYACSFKNFKSAPKPQEEAAANYYSDKYVVQPLIECDGRDLRVYVIGGHIIGAVIRKANGGFKSNFSLGGTVEPYTLNKEQESIVKKITDSIAIDYAGLDFLVCGEDDALIFNEMEDVVGARMLSACSDIDYIGCYIRHIKLTIQSTYNSYNSITPGIYNI